MASILDRETAPIYEQLLYERLSEYAGVGPNDDTTPIYDQLVAEIGQPKPPKLRTLHLPLRYITETTQEAFDTEYPPLRSV